MTFGSCDPCGDGGDFYTNNTLEFNILDKHTKKNVLVLGDTQYGLDSVNIRNTDGSVVTYSQVRNDGLCLFHYVANADQGKVNQLISRRFYMHLDQTDNDTIDVSFNMHYTKCHNQVLTYFKISYNDSVYYDGNTDHPPPINFLK